MHWGSRVTIQFLIIGDLLTENIVLLRRKAQVAYFLGTKCKRIISFFRTHRNPTMATTGEPAKSYGYGHRGGRRFGIDESYIDAGEAGVLEFIRSHNLRVGESQALRDLDSTIKHRTPNKGGRTPTVLSYTAYLEEMLLVAYLVGDYRSAALLNRDLCPENPFPLTPSFVEIYYSFKCGEPGVPICYPNTTRQIRTNGQNSVLKSVGTWHAPTCLNKLHGAVGALESLYAHMHTEYEEICDHCVRANQLRPEADTTARSDWLSCPDHAGRPVLVARGSVLRSLQVIGVHEKWKMLLGKHKVRGNIALLPSQVRQIRLHLVNINDLECLQTYVMMIVGIKLFLRAEELCDLMIDKFNLSPHVVHPDCVKSLTVEMW